ncbi:MAG: hypothetical protein M0R68_12345, partial [Bacteroidetes bacterium]|nr:hypothetical protein [Bacteroidota bacterium]
MKSIFICMMLFAFTLTTAQTKMYINKTSGGTDSIALSEIKGISFRSVPTDRQILFQEYFENGNLDSWLQVSTPVISSLESVSPSHSLTLPVNRGDYCFIYKNFSDSIRSGIVGLEYYMMKKDSTVKTSFYGLLYQQQYQSIFNVYLLSGFVGGPRYDTLVASTWDSNTPDIYIYNKSIAKITINKWYKFNFEYDFNTQTASYFLDGIKVGEHNYPISYFDSIMF